MEPERKWKRRSGIGRLRPNVVLYEEEHPRGETIGAVAEQDLRKGPDIILVVGTALKVPEARRLVRELCCAAARGGLTARINKHAAPSWLKLSSDIEILRDCNEVGSLLSC